MAINYSSTTISGFNATPPADDGARVSSNQLGWDKHISKIGTPLKNAIESIDSELVTTFAEVSAEIDSDVAAHVTAEHTSTGQVIQAVEGAVDGVNLLNLADTHLTTTPYTNLTSTPPYTEGDLILTATITPTSASNFLEFEIHVPGANGTAGGFGILTLHQAGGNAINAIAESIGSEQRILSMRYRMQSPGTSSVTFQVRAGGLAGIGLRINANGSGTQLFGGVTQCSMVVRETRA